MREWWSKFCRRRWLGGGIATLAAAALAVVAIAMAAAAIPVWRATKVDAAARLHRA